MKNIKSVNEFFNFLKKNDDDQIAIHFIQRLKKVKGKSPYKIDQTSDSRFRDGVKVNNTSYNITFDDVVLEVRLKYTIHVTKRMFSTSNYKVLIKSIGGEEELKCSKKYQEKLFDVINKIYLKDDNDDRINRIKGEINPAADIL